MSDIKFGLQIASGVCTGNPISESDIKRLQVYINKFPDVRGKAQEAWDMQVEDELLKDLVSRVSEASDRLSAVYTMICDIVPALDACQYDFYTVNAVLPYLTFTLDTLEEMVKEFEADLTILRNTIEPVDLSDNKLFKRVVRFIDESLKALLQCTPLRHRLWVSCICSSIHEEVCTRGRTQPFRVRTWGHLLQFQRL